jgi:hypothetical protein
MDGEPWACSACHADFGEPAGVVRTIVRVAAAAERTERETTVAMQLGDGATAMTIRTRAEAPRCPTCSAPIVVAEGRARCIGCGAIDRGLRDLGAPGLASIDLPRDEAGYREGEHPEEIVWLHLGREIGRSASPSKAVRMTATIIVTIAFVMAIGWIVCR